MTEEQTQIEDLKCLNEQMEAMYDSINVAMGFVSSCAVSHLLEAIKSISQARMEIYAAQKIIEEEVINGKSHTIN